MASYLFRNRNGNYYTRVPFPLELKHLNYPQEIRISLLTKDREIATFRNLIAAFQVKTLIEKLRVNAKRPEINPELLEKIRQKREKIIIDELTLPIKEEMRKQQYALILERNKAVKEVKKLNAALEESVAQMATIKSRAKQIVQTVHANAQQTLTKANTEREIIETLKDQISGISKKITLSQLRDSFIQLKETECNREELAKKTLKQLSVRTKDFIDFIGNHIFAHEVGFEHASQYITHIEKELNLKAKTLNGYKSASSQMFSHALHMETIRKNPFEHIKIKKSAPESRPIWTKHQLTQLFSTDVFSNHTYKNIDDYWIPLLLLHTGARPSVVV